MKVTSQNKMMLDDFINQKGNRDWEDFYCANISQDINEDDDEDPNLNYQKYLASPNNVSELGFNNSKSHLQEILEGGVHTDLLQSKVYDRTFIAQGEYMNVYREDPYDPMSLEVLLIVQLQAYSQATSSDYSHWRNPDS